LQALSCIKIVEYDAGEFMEVFKDGHPAVNKPV